jgi:hypothetical protein
VNGIMGINNLLRVFLSRIIIISLLTAIGAADAFGIWIEPYLKKLDTKDVKSIKIINYSFADGEWQETDVMTAEYSSTGNLMHETRHTADGLLQFDYSYSYNEKGEMIEVTGRRMRNEKIVPYEYRYMYDQRGNQINGIGYGADGTETSKYTARYDKNNNFVEGIEYEDGVAVSKYVAEYDAQNNLTEESKYTVYRYKESERYQLEYKHLFNYDSKNNLVTEKQYGNSEALEYDYRYQYDADNNLVKGSSYDEEGSVVSQYFAEYDDHSNLVKSVHYGPCGKITSSHIARYDKNNNMIEEINCISDTMKRVYDAGYDETGNMIEETHYGENGLGGTDLDYRYSYGYDHRNNRISEIYYVYFQEENRWKPISKQVNEINYRK